MHSGIYIYIYSAESDDVRDDVIFTSQNIMRIWQQMF